MHRSLCPHRFDSFLVCPLSTIHSPQLINVVCSQNSPETPANQYTTTGMVWWDFVGNYPESENVSVPSSGHPVSSWHSTSCGNKKRPTSISIPTYMPVSLYFVEPTSEAFCHCYRKWNRSRLSSKLGTTIVATSSPKNLVDINRARVRKIANVICWNISSISTRPLPGENPFYNWSGSYGCVTPAGQEKTQWVTRTPWVLLDQFLVLCSVGLGLY